MYPNVIGNTGVRWTLRAIGVMAEMISTTGRWVTEPMTCYRIMLDDVRTKDTENSIQSSSKYIKRAVLKYVRKSCVLD